MPTHKSEDPLAGGSIADENTEQAPIFNELEAERKEFETLRARFAMLGHCLYRPADGSGGLSVTRWGQVRHLESLEEARRFLAQIGGRKP